MSHILKPSNVAYALIFLKVSNRNSSPVYIQQTLEKLRVQSKP